MESQTEQSQSPELGNLLPQPPVLQQPPQSQTQPEPESPASLQIQAESPPSDIVGTEDAEQSKDIATQVQDVAEVEAQAVVAPEAVAPEPEQIKNFEYKSLADVKVGDLSPEILAHVEPIMKIVQNEVSALKSQQESLASSRKEFSDLIEAMESSGYDVKPLQARIEEQSTFINTMSSDMVDTAWQAFTATHPEFDRLPENARDAFATELDSLFERHSGKTVLDRMNGAYDYALWKSGVNKSTLSAPEPVQAEAAPAVEKPKANGYAKKQALIADGRIATSSPVRSVDELDWNEVLNRHAHLLDG